jgi:hypothetical protein
MLKFFPDMTASVAHESQWITIEIDGPEKYIHFNRCGHFCREAYLNRAVCCLCAGATELCYICQESKS